MDTAPGRPTAVSFARVDDAYARFYARVREQAARPGVRRICEVGGGANPALPLEFSRAHGIDYVVLDRSADELAKAPEGYIKVAADITDPNLRVAGGFDLVFSFQLAEHVRSGRELHRNIFGLLAPGGTAIHFFPTLYALPLLVNKVLPEALLQRLVVALWPERNSRGRRGKFPAYYDWCRGPGPRQSARFESLGYHVDEYVGFFGHSYYDSVPPARDLMVAAWGFLAEHPVAALTSCAIVVLSRP